MSRSGRRAPVTPPGPADGSPRTALPELLAPAGSPDALRAALAAGADAVYLSGKRFGARKYAANFSDGELAEGIRLAHSRGVRVYVTVNTLIHDRELRRVQEYLVWLYAAGADAVLVQDTGVAALAREVVPDLPLHASTQMTIHNTDGVLRAAEQGFSRVVLSRELPLEEIRAIAEATKQTGTGLEIFAHGALCYSYSGQCLLSSVIGGRSGNRGMCAQPCRKPYMLVTGSRDRFGRPERVTEVPVKGRYLLSPKDLCTYRNLADLAHAPVVSLKIEGRMKSPEYVAIVVSAYRRALDAIRAGDRMPEPEAEQDLLLAFNRGFTKGYLFGDRHGALMARDAPDNRGVCIGTVARQDRRSGNVIVQLDGTLVPEAGDGLLFSDPAGRTGERGFMLNNTPVTIGAKTIMFGVPRPVAPGSQVSITSSRNLEARARQIIARPPDDLVRRVPVDLAVTVDSRGGIRMEGVLEPWPGKEVRVSYRPDFSLVPARSRPLTAVGLEEQLRKSGDTPFAIRACSVTYDGALFAPLGEINRMRREFLLRAHEALLAALAPPEEDVARARQRLERILPRDAAAGGRETGRPAESLTLTVCADSTEAVLEAVKHGCTSICFEPACSLLRHSCGTGGGERPSILEQVKEARAICRDAGAGFVLKLPRITRNGYLDAVLPEIASLHRDGLAACMVENPGAAHAIHALLPDMRLCGAAGLNIFNHRSACRISPPFLSLTLSPELSGDECRDLVRAARGAGCRVSFSLVVQGLCEAMVTEDCPLEPVQHCRAGSGDGRGSAFFGIRDGTGRIFPLRTDGGCRTQIFNSVETCLVDHLPAIRQAGISEIVIDARGRTGAYAGAMTGVYREAIRHCHAGSGPEGVAFGNLKERIKALAYGGITVGHFTRGLKE